MTDVAANPLGTGPPPGAVVGAVVGVAAVGLADPPGPDGEAEFAPPDADDAADAGDAVDVLPAAPPPAPLELAVPHADSATAASKAPDASAARDAPNDVPMRSPTDLDRFLRLWRRASTAPG